MAATPESLRKESDLRGNRKSGRKSGRKTDLTEQHIQPFANSSHSSTCWPSLETVRDFSISTAFEG
jgi:hypothetical protein